MKLYKGFYHFLITLVSVFAFLAGWATLAHSLKPLQPVQAEKVAALEPLPPVGLSSAPSRSTGLQLFSPAPQPRPRSVFVTRGS